MKKIHLLGLVLLVTGTVNAQHFVDHYVTGTPTFIEIGNSSDKITGPTDLDFHPDRPKELWVGNHGGSSGGSMVIFSDATTDNPSSVYRKDVSAGHFMLKMTAFSIGGDEPGSSGFATAQGSMGNGGSLFMGPSLYPATAAEFGIKNGPNGCHLDMLHQSPYGLGIAHIAANKYYYNDGYRGAILMYDFAIDHGPGNDDHSDGVVRRYEGLNLPTVSGTTTPLPQHIAFDKASNWLYVCDSKSGKIWRLKTNSGTEGSSISPYGEPLASFKKITGATFESYINLPGGLAGIDYVDGRLIASDFDSGEIIIIDATGSTGVELGRFSVPGVTASETGHALGVKIGPDGRIWYVNYRDDKIYKVEPEIDLTTVKEFTNSENIEVYPNPSSGLVNVRFNSGKINDKYTVRVIDLIGKEVMNENIYLNNKVENFDFSYLPKGVYELNIASGEENITKKITIQ